MNRMTGFVLSGIVTAAMMGSAMAASTAPATAPASSATTAAPMAAAPAAAPAVATSSQVPTAHKETQHASLSRKRVEEVQAALKNNGEQVAVDGIWGHKTTSAVEDFQKKHGIKPTGHADPATLQQLKVMSM